MRVAHVITSLDGDGAQRVLLRTLHALKETIDEHHVVCLAGPAELSEAFANATASLVHLGVRPSAPNPFRLAKGGGLLKSLAPDAIVSWLYHADLATALWQPWTRGVPVVWNVRHAAADHASTKRATRAVIRGCAACARHLPTQIVFNSSLSRDHHVKLGYPSNRSCVIPNGFDLCRFKPQQTAAHGLRNELGVAPNVPLVGLVARMHPDKDFTTFLLAASQIVKQHPHTNFVMCGRGVSLVADEIAPFAARPELRGKVHALGQRDDLADIYSALDVSVCSSRTEGFPNVVGEAMACETPVVVTDVGDARYLVGDCGTVVPPAAPAELASAVNGLLALPAAARQQLGEQGRARIANQFELAEMSRRHRKVWQAAAAGGAIRVNRRAA